MSNQWDKYAQIFDSGIGDGNEDLHKNLLDPLIFKYLGDRHYSTVVDAGCGNGYLLNKLVDHSAKVIGLDYSEKLLEIAKKRTAIHNNIEILRADFTEKLPLGNDSADAVIANMVLQYVPSLEMFANESHRILRKDGIIIVLVDHPGHYLYARAQELAGKKDSHFINLGSYFKSERIKKNSLWGKALLEYYHRPISEYINPFTKYFCLSEINEISEDSEKPRILGLKFHPRSL